LSPFGLAYDALIRLTASESMYSSFAYLKQKWFKKEVIFFQFIFETLKNQLNGMEWNEYRVLQ